MRFANTDIGAKINVVSFLRCLDPDQEAHLFQSIPDNVMFNVSGLIEGSGEVFTFLGASMVRQYPKPALMIDSDTKILQHCQPTWTTVCEVVELCSGFGGMSQGYSALGFSPVLAVDFNEKMTNLYRKQCEVTTLNADVSKVDSIAKIWHLSRGASTIVAGYACQPFSSLGDRRGEHDGRAMSLRGVLAIAFYTRAQAIVLECVVPASKNSWVMSEIQKFVDATGFHLSQSELHLSDIWPSRRSRAWWLITAPWLGTIPLPDWPKLLTVQKVCQVIPRVLAWAPEDEAKLVLNAIERHAFGVDDNTCAKYLLNMDGCAPCALHSWGSQLVPCECGCRPCGLSMKRLEEKGLFGLLVRSVSDAFSQECRHIHPNECLALQGFDPTIDFGDNPRLTLSAAGQMASPFQALWVFSCLAERIAQLRFGNVIFGSLAQLQAYQSWVLMRCRRVWPCDTEPVEDSKMLSLMNFWTEVADLSIHELMHPPRWPQLEDAHVTIASVLDLLIRRSQNCLPGRHLAPGVLAIPDEVDEEVDDSTPWIESPHDMPRLPKPRSDACIVVFFHEFADPITLLAAPGCTIYDFVQAHEKLVGTLQVTCISNFHGVEVHPSQRLEPGMVICIRCEDMPASTGSSSGDRVSGEPLITTVCQEPHVNPASDDMKDEPPALPNIRAIAQTLPVVASESLTSTSDQHCGDALLHAAGGGVISDLISPTAPWTQLIQGMPDAETGPCPEAPSQPMPSLGDSARNTSWISAAPLLGLKEDQFLQLRVPAVVNMQHLESLRCQIMNADDRLTILEHQSRIWSDDELRFHMHSLAHSYIQFQLSHGIACPKPCFVLDPLLATGWLHHGLHECAAWGLAHKQIREQGQMVITACMVQGHWIPVVMCSQGLILHVYTWDSPGHDHDKLNKMCALLAKAMGYDDVAADRHHRLFLSSDRCGALAMAFLSYSLLQTMLPTTSDETETIHLRLKTSFADALAKHQTTVRPWVWGAGDLLTDALGACDDVSQEGLQSAHVCIDADRRLELLRDHGMEWGDDEIRFHIKLLLDHGECILNKDDNDVPGFVFLDPLSLSDWNPTGKEKFIQWCKTNPHIIETGHHIVTALLVHQHWVPMWIVPYDRYFLVHLQHDEITRVDDFGHLLDALCSQFGLPEYVLHWTPQLVPNHRICGAAAIAFLGHVLVRADLPEDLFTLRNMQANMRASFVQAVFQNQCCRCPVAWGAGPQLKGLFPIETFVNMQEYELMESHPGAVNSFGNLMEGVLSQTIARDARPMLEVLPQMSFLEAGLEPELCTYTGDQVQGYPAQVLDLGDFADSQKVWTDAELGFHLMRVVDAANDGLCCKSHVGPWTYLVPFAAQHMPQAAVTICNQIVVLDKHSQGGLITAVLFHGHWIPLVIRRSHAHLCIDTWNFGISVVTQLREFGDMIAHQLAVSQCVLTCRKRAYRSPDMCGALTMAFMHFCLLDTPLPINTGELTRLNDQLKTQFAVHLRQHNRSHVWTMLGHGDAADEEDQQSQGPANRSHTCITAEQRLDLLRGHEKEWGDDEIRYHLSNLLAHNDHAVHLRHCNIPGMVLLEPLMLHNWHSIGPALCESWCRAHAHEIASGFHIISALLVRDHWVPVWIVPHRHLLQFHLMHDGLTHACDFEPLVHILCSALGFTDHVLHWLPQRVSEHSYCGAATIAFLGHILVGGPLPDDLKAIQDMHANMRASFVQAVLQDQCCRCPIAWGSGPPATLIKALSEELSKHGVPESQLESRAQQAIRAIGQEPVQHALQAKNVWRSLKAIGSNVKFQFILPDELDQLVQANKGANVGKKIRSAKINAKIPVPDVLDPAKISLLDGAFRFAGNPVPQIAAQQIGPVATGIAVLSMKDAIPYLKVGKPVSSAPLAIVVLTDPTCQVQTVLPHVKLMVPCICLANNEPLLVEATLVQLGVGHVEKHIAANAIALDSLDVVTVKIMTYRDEYAGSWDDFTSAPIKQLVQAFPILRRCFESGCNCECWHNPDDLQVKEPIMDVWRRQFLSLNFRPVAPGKAAIFSVCLRVPTAILSNLLARSGHAGSYMEPRTPDGKQVMEEYVVVWAPRLSSSELAHMKQTNPAVLGLARLGERRGLRVMQAQAPAIHAIVRPEATYLPNGPKMQFSAGPFPWGSDRAAITKALKQVGWQVQALQPMQPVPGKGSMWLIQSVDNPPETILCTNHGEVVITTHKAGNQPSKPVGNFTVGSVSTLSLCGPASVPPVQETDPWLQGDPWGPYNKTKQTHPVTAASDGIQQLEERIQTAVLAKLPVSMDQDDMPQRLHSLEEQVHLLMGKNQNLESQFHEFSAQSNQQFAVVQTQIQQQSTQFHGQLESQSQSIQAMFEQQMNQIRGLLSKRPREETME